MCLTWKLVDFMTENDAEIDLGEGFADSDDSWEYEVEKICCTPDQPKPRPSHTGVNPLPTKVKKIWPSWNSFKTLSPT